MRLRVLGSAAGGGFPQWNCQCANCAGVRRGAPELAARTQDSIALFDGESAVVCNASPDIARQIEACPELHPRMRRHTPISAIVLTNGDLDHVLGLLSLRESQPLAIYATASVRRALVDRNAMLATLARTPDQVAWRTLELDREITLADPGNRMLGIAVRPVAVAGKAPAHLRGEPFHAEDNIALEIRDLRSDRRVTYAPNAAGPVDGLGDGTDAMLFDGTFWSSDELIRLELGTARAEDMAHLPVTNSLWRVRPRSGRKIYTHINNTNPILAADSPERRLVEDAGWEIAEDGLEIEL